MKKSAFFAALLCAVSSGAYAASDVTLYGVVDESRLGFQSQRPGRTSGF